MKPDTGKAHWLSNNTGINFTVNLAATEVVLNCPAPVDLLPGPAGSFPFFQARENIYLESIKLVHPYQFGQGTLRPELARVQLFWYDALANFNAIDELDYGSTILIPDPNVETELGIFIKYPFLAAERWGLRVMSMDFHRVSMFNVPAALAGVTLDSHFMVKVRHTLPLIA